MDVFMKLEIMGREGGAERQTEHDSLGERDSALGRDSQSVRRGQRDQHTQWVKERERERKAEKDRDRKEQRVRNKEKQGERERQRDRTRD